MVFQAFFKRRLGSHNQRLQSLELEPHHFGGFLIAQSFIETEIQCNPLPLWLSRYFLLKYFLFLRVYHSDIGADPVISDCRLLIAKLEWFFLFPPVETQINHDPVKPSGEFVISLGLPPARI